MVFPGQSHPSFRLTHTRPPFLIWSEKREKYADFSNKFHKHQIKYLQYIYDTPISNSCQFHPLIYYFHKKNNSDTPKLYCFHLHPFCTLSFIRVSVSVPSLIQPTIFSNQIQLQALKVMTLICNEVLHQTFSYRFFFGEARQAFGATIPLLENGYPWISHQNRIQEGLVEEQR